MSFEGKVILITGGSSKNGALLALVGRNVEKFDKVIEDIKELGVENEPLVILADVSTDAERIVSETIAKYGRLDILINNAGCAVSGGIQTKLEDYDRVMGVNLRAVFELTQLCTPHLIESKGNIINVSSIAGIIAMEELLVYGMSKAALDKFTKHLAMELAPKGVRVNSLNPGTIDTDFFDHFTSLKMGTDEYANHINTLGEKYPLQRVGHTDECVDAIAFLASDKASFVTGVILPLDGGIVNKMVI